jgi:hypothetical protein
MKYQERYKRVLAVSAYKASDDSPAAAARAFKTAKR